MTELKLKGVVVKKQGVFSQNHISIRDTRTTEGTNSALRVKFFNKEDFPFKKGDVVKVIIKVSEEK